MRAMRFVMNYSVHVNYLFLYTPKGLCGHMREREAVRERASVSALCVRAREGVDETVH